MPDLAMKVLQNPELAREAMGSAEKILEEGLEKYPLLLKRLEKFSQKLHWE